MRILWLSIFLLFSLNSMSVANTPDPQNAAQAASGELWNAVRARQGSDLGTVRSQVKGIDSSEFMNADSGEWIKFRMEQLIPTAAKVLGFSLLGILLFRLIRGKIKIKSGRTTKRIKRFSTFQRWVHWITAILFVALALSGIVLMFGRFIIIPYIGPELGGPLTLFMKRIHDISGPAFAVSLIVLTFTFIKGNFPHWRDIIWIVKGGGLLGGHAPAGRYNAGEKGWYWIAVFVGLVVVGSGLALDFTSLLSYTPFGETRDSLTYAHWMHSIAAVAVMTGALGHIYMGTIAMEGAFEVMQTGYCDANWAKEHHDVWYDEMIEKGKVIESKDIT
ncbi:MAG: formate dehydrogenase subunit gamma [Leucothrix sp.]